MESKGLDLENQVIEKLYLTSDISPIENQLLSQKWLLDLVVKILFVEFLSPRLPRIILGINTSRMF